MVKSPFNYVEQIEGKNDALRNDQKRPDNFRLFLRPLYSLKNQRNKNGKRRVFIHVSPFI